MQRRFKQKTGLQIKANLIATHFCASCRQIKEFKRRCKSLEQSSAAICGRSDDEIRRVQREINLFHGYIELLKFQPKIQKRSSSERDWEKKWERKKTCGGAKKKISDRRDDVRNRWWRHGLTDAASGGEAEPEARAPNLTVEAELHVVHVDQGLDAGLQAGELLKEQVGIARCSVKALPTFQTRTTMD